MGGHRETPKIGVDDDKARLPFPARMTRRGAGICTCVHQARFWTRSETHPLVI